MILWGFPRGGRGTRPRSDNSSSPSPRIHRHSVSFNFATFRGVGEGATTSLDRPRDQGMDQGTRFEADFPPPPVGYRSTWISLSNVLWDFVDAWQIDPGTATAFRRIRPVCRDINDTTVSSLSLSLFLACVGRDFYIFFFFPDIVEGIGHGWITMKLQFFAGERLVGDLLFHRAIV